MSVIGEAAVRIRPDTTGFQGEAHRSIIGSVARIGAAVGVAAAGFKVFQFAKDSIIGFNSQLQQSRAAFTTLTGSTKQANVVLQQLQTFAKTTPYDFQGLLPVAQQLMGALGKGTKIIPIMHQLGDAIAATGGSSDSLRLLTLAYTQMATSGTAHLGDLMQINNAVPGALARMAAAGGMSIGKFRAAVSAGAISSTKAVQLFTKVTTDPKFGIAGGMKAQSTTFAGAMSNIHDALQQTLAKAGLPFFNFINRLAQRLAGFLSGNQFTRWASTASKAMTDVIARVTGLLSGAFSGGGASRLAAQAMAVFGTIRGVVTGVLIPTIQAAFRQIGPLIVQLLAALRPAAPFLQNVIVPILIGLGRAIIGSLVTAIKIAIPVISLIARALGYIGNAAKPLRPYLIILGEVIGVLFPGAALRMIGFLGKLGRFLGIFGGTVSKIGSVVGRSVSLILGLWTRLTNLGGALFVRLAGKIASVVLGLVARVLGHFAGLTSRGVALISTLVSRFIGVFGTLPGRAIAVAARIVSGVLGRLGALAAGAARALGRLAAAVAGALARAAAVALTSAKRIGTEIISGIEAGLEAAVGGLLAKARGIASSITSAIGGALHIGSPSRVMRDYIGKNIIIGIMEGMRLTTPQMVAFANKTAAHMTKSMADTIATSIRGALTKMRDGFAAYRSAIGTAVSSIRKTLTDQWKTIHSQMSDTFGGLFQTTGLQDAISNGGKITAADLKASLSEQIKTFQDYQANLVKLRRLGISKGLMSQLLGMGASGMPEVAALAGGSRGDLMAIQRMLGARSDLINRAASAQFATIGGRTVNVRGGGHRFAIDVPSGATPAQVMASVTRQVGTEQKKTNTILDDIRKLLGANNRDLVHAIQTGRMPGPHDGKDGNSAARGVRRRSGGRR